MYALHEFGVINLDHLLLNIGGGPPKRGRPATVRDPACMYSGVCQVGKKAGVWVGKR